MAASRTRTPPVPVTAARCPPPLSHATDLHGFVVGRCRALVHVDKREQEGYKYVPRPISTTDVDVNFANDAQLSWLTVKLALHAHDVWAKRKLAQVNASTVV